jgi:hypothetical protein
MHVKPQSVWVEIFVTQYLLKILRISVEKYSKYLIIKTLIDLNLNLNLNLKFNVDFYQCMIAGHLEQHGRQQPAGRPESVGYPCSSSWVC